MSHEANIWIPLPEGMTEFNDEFREKDAYVLALSEIINFTARGKYTLARPPHGGGFLPRFKGIGVAGEDVFRKYPEMIGRPCAHYRFYTEEGPED